MVGKSGSRGPGAPTASVSEAAGRPPAEAREAAGVGWFFCPLRAGSGPMGGGQGGVTSGQRPGWTQGSGCRPPALCRSLRLSRRLMGPRPRRRNHRPFLQPPQRLQAACGEAPAVSSRAHPPAAHRPPWAPFPPSTGPGTTPHPHAHRGRAPGASGNRRSDAGLGGLPSCGTEAAAAHGVNQRGSRTSSGDSWSGRQGWASTVMRVTKDLRARQLLNWATYCIAKTTPDLPPAAPIRGRSPQSRAAEGRRGSQPRSHPCNPRRTIYCDEN